MKTKFIINKPNFNEKKDEKTINKQIELFRERTRTLTNLKRETSMIFNENQVCFLFFYTKLNNCFLKIINIKKDISIEYKKKSTIGSETEKIFINTDSLALKLKNKETFQKLVGLLKTNMFKLVFSDTSRANSQNSLKIEKKPKSPKINIIKSPSLSRHKSTSPNSRNRLKSMNSDNSKSKTPSPIRVSIKETGKQNSFIIDDVITKVPLKYPF